MTDWRQIQARIRKAKNSPEALNKLNELFLRTRDGMVAWELGVIEEKAERMDQAVKWYTTAAERFRRSEWKKKAEEALTRLGAPVPTGIAEAAHEHPSEASQAPPADRPRPAAEEDEENVEEEAAQALAYGEIPESEYAEAPSAEPARGAPAAASGNVNIAGGPPKKKRRRGRRGGRGRRRKEAPGTPSLPAQAFAEAAESQPPIEPQPPAQPFRPEVSAPLSFHQLEPRSAPNERPATVERKPAPPIRQAPVEAPMPAPQLPSERTAHGRAGDPALASRMAQLESMLRRLLSSPLHRLEEAEHAPAGPGVFLLSDSDQTSSYYVEACQTLRVGLGNLVRGGRGGKNIRGGRNYSDSGSGLKSRLAEHLGINESKVSQYMKDHCVVRWVQLDDDAPHLAHFVIGVLRTPLNIES